MGSDFVSVQVCEQFDRYMGSKKEGRINWIIHS